VYLIYICASILLTYIRCDLYLPACVKTKAKTIAITEKKKCPKKVQKLKKKVWLRLGLNPQLRWLTIVCVRGFDRNIQQLLTVSSLHHYLQHAVKNEQKHLSIISNEHI